MILQKIIKTDKATILVIGGLPEDAKDIKTIPPLLRYVINNEIRVSGAFIPPGKWQPVGFLKSISDTDAIQIVNIWSATFDGKKYSYMNYITKWYCEDPKESLHSLVAANCPDFKNDFLLKKID